MIGSLMYVTASRPDIMFVVCACSRFQVTPKTSHLSAVKRIFRYLKGKPKLGLWYPRDSSFDLESYSDSDYAGANLDRKSTTGGCQFLGRRLITWQCKKQTIVATSTTEAEYVAAASCCGQVLWIQNQMLDYGFNFMNTKIYIDNESTICIVKNPVYHSKTKHIAIRHHFIRDAYEKKLIQVLKIHTDDNVADLLTKAFDVSRFQFLVVSIGMKIAQVVCAWIKSKNSLVKHFEDMRLSRSSKRRVYVMFDHKGDAYHWRGVYQLEVMLVNALRRYRESLRRVTDGAEAFLILTLFILCLDKVSTDHAKLVPLGKVTQTYKNPFQSHTYSSNLSNCHSSLQALISLTDDLSLLIKMAALESCPKHNMIAYLEKTEGNVEFHEVIDFLRRSYIYHALTVSPIVSTTFVEQFWTSAKSKTINNVRHITAKVAGKVVSISLRKVTPLFASMLVQPTEDEGAPSERPSEAKPTPSPAHTSEVPFEPQTDSSPAHISEAPIEPQTDPSARPSPSTIIPDSIPESSGGNLGDQAKEIQHLKAQIKNLRKQAKPVIKHHRAWMQSVSLKQRLARKRSSKKQWVHKESVSKQGRKFAKGEPSVQRDPLFDEIPEDTLDHMETEDAQDVGRTRDIVGEEKENDENVLSTEDVLSNDRQIEGTDERIEGTNEQRKGTDDHTEEGSVTQTTQPPPTSTIFGDDETIAKVLLNMSQAKAVS
ncbi:hypothetical protein Tco_0588569, partial [Tanacetum coccineum]